MACFYIAGERKVANLLAKTVMTRMGWFTPPFDTAGEARQRLIPYYDILDFYVEGAMNGSFVRSIGIVRAKAATALTCLVYNIFRYVQINKYQPQLIASMG